MTVMVISIMMMAAADNGSDDGDGGITNLQAAFLIFSSPGACIEAHDALNPS